MQVRIFSTQSSDSKTGRHSVRVSPRKAAQIMATRKQTARSRARKGDMLIQGKLLVTCHQPGPTSPVASKLQHPYNPISFQQAHQQAHEALGAYLDTNHNSHFTGLLLCFQNNYHSIFCFYKFNYARYLMKVESKGIFPFTTGLFQLTQWPRCLCMLQHMQNFYLSTLHICHIMDKYSSIDEHLCCLQPMANVSNATMNMSMQISTQLSALIQKQNCWIRWQF